MTDSSWPRVKALFQAAVERPIEDRHAFLVAEAGDDEVLRREVESLLASDALEGSFLDRLPTAHGSVLDDSLAAQLASADHAASRAVLTAGVRVGPYEILAPLGAGAMGEVYRARDTKLNRDVALKVLPERFALDPDRLARFAREAQMLATLNHPNIAAIYGLEELPSRVGGDRIRAQSRASAGAGVGRRAHARGPDRTGADVARRSDDHRASDRGRPRGGAREGDCSSRHQAGEYQDSPVMA